MMPRRTPTAVLLLALAGPLFPASPGVAAEGSDPRAVAVAEGLIERLGGAEAWEQARFFRFTFAGFRSHWWDKWSGRHRLEYTDRGGDRFVVLHNLQSRQGEAWKNGERLTGEAAAKALQGAYGAWINDTYWLLAPFKLLDPGVTLSLSGHEEPTGGRAFDELVLTFDGVGLTPGDRYSFYVDRGTGLMDRWAYVLEGWEEGRPPTVWRWLDWDRHGGLLLSARRVDVDSGRELTFDDIGVTDSLPETVFTSPEPLTGEDPAA